MVDEAASKAGKSDEYAKMFISLNAEKSFFKTTAEERSNPFLNGNSDGTYTPEQQARWGIQGPGMKMQAAVTKAEEYLGRACYDCREKFNVIEGAVSALIEARTLYQDDTDSVALIDRQIAKISAGISSDEVVRGAAGAISDRAKEIAGILLGQPSKRISGKTVQTLDVIAVGQSLDFNEKGIKTYLTSNKYAFTASKDIVETGKALENSAQRFIQDEAGEGFLGFFSTKHGGNKGFDLGYAKMVDGKPQLVIGEAKAGDSALTALGENREATLTANLKVLDDRLKEIRDPQLRDALREQLRDKTYIVEIYVATANASKTAARVDEVLTDRLGQPITRIVKFPKEKK